MGSPVAISLSPNAFPEDILLVLKIIFSPWCWHQINQIKKLEAEFRQFFKVRYAISFNSGRVAEYALLKAVGVGGGDEVLVPAFTCVVVPNSVLWLKAKPVYVDFEK
jgi:perosamine synthetase